MITSSHDANLSTMLGLSTGQPPGDEPRILRYIFAKNLPGGVPLDLLVRLYDGDTLLEEWVEENLPATWTTREYELRIVWSFGFLPTVATSHGQSRINGLPGISSLALQPLGGFRKKLDQPVKNTMGQVHLFIGLLRLLSLDQNNYHSSNLQDNCHSDCSQAGPLATVFHHEFHAMHSS